MTFEVQRRVPADVPERSAAEAAALIPDRGTVLTSGFGSVGYPKAVPRALAEADRDLELTVVSGGSVGDEIDDLLVEAGAIERRFPYQARPAARREVNARRIAFHDRNISTLGDEVEFEQLVSPDVAVVEAVAVGEDWFVPSTSIGPTPQFVDSVETLVVEVNRRQPLALQQLHDVYRSPGTDPVPLSAPDERIGSPRIRFDPGTLAAVVRTDAPDSPYTFRDLTPAERGIGSNLAAFLSSEMSDQGPFSGSIALQFGVGSVGNALMGELDAVEFGNRDVYYAGEVIQDGLLDSLDSGLLTAASATSLALSESGQERLFDDVEGYAEDVVVRSSNVSNDPSVIARFRTIAVNSAVEVDIYGHANSTHVNGTHLVNGIGGGGDFVRNALLSVIALPSTAKDGDVSRIVPMVPHVDHTEHDVDAVVTEHGVADLRGRSPVERAEAIVEECAHPSYRGDLRAYLDRAREAEGHVPHDLESAFDWKTGRVE